MDNLDFDFFDTPRANETGVKSFDIKSAPDKPLSMPKPGEKDRTGGRESGKQKTSSERDSKIRDTRDSFSSDENSDYSHSGSESETPRSERAPARNDRKNEKKKRTNNKYDSVSESSSAYSNSDYSSDESIDDKRDRKKETIEVKMPKVQEAWGFGEKHDGASKKGSRHQDDRDGRSAGGRNDNDRRNRYKKSQKNSSDLSDSDSDNCLEEKQTNKQNVANNRNERVKSAKPAHRNRRGANRDRLTRSNSSHSNNSDITDVSPLGSDDESPRNEKRLSRSDSKVQYDSSPDRNGSDIKLETDKIDLSILMKCMADIDREKQQRLKTNSRRVMFAPPALSEKTKSNYTFDSTRAKSIEQENQRLLKQIMTHINPSSTKLKSTVTPTRGPRKAVEPVVHRMTPSAVNRMKEQRRIENENMKMLQRLNHVRPSSGMSRHQQLKEFEKTASYGIPTGTLLVPGDTSQYETFHRSGHSSMSFHTPGSTQRSRPSSAKSNSSQIPGRRSRPSSAKSNASVRSVGSVRSNASMRSTASKRSGSLLYGMKKDQRPDWNDRFSVS